MLRSRYRERLHRRSGTESHQVPVLVMICIAASIAAASPAGSQEASEQVARRYFGIHPEWTVLGSIRPDQSDDENQDADILQYGLTRADFKAIVESIPTVQRAIPWRQMLSDASSAESDEREKVTLVGTVPDWHEAASIVIQRGRFLSAVEVARNANVMVIDERLASSLFPAGNPIGKVIEIADTTFTIVGVCEPFERVDFDEEQNEDLLRDFARSPVFIPLTTMNRRFGDQVISSDNSVQHESYELSGIAIQATDRSTREPTIEVLQALLELSHSDGSVAIDAPR